ncbi:MAG: inorganic phosphate transporter [Acidobacteriaceae bacterium]
MESTTTLNSKVQPLGTSMMDQKLSRSPGKIAMIVFGCAIAGGIVYAGLKLGSDLATTHYPTVWPYVLLGVALLIALGFEFVNGFHDTANAVATVIYTHSLEPHVAVVWSGMWNLIGVLLSSGAVAFAVVSLLPVELILHVGSNAGFAMVFALLISAIMWNLGTWWLGLPASSSHTLIGSIIGVGLANQFLAAKAGAGTGTSGVDWAQTVNVFKALLISPLVGFFLSALLLLLFKALIKDPRLYEAPKGTEPPPFWIRFLLIGTCTGVSFAHGSNDGQKGMGLIMLILIGTVPTAYALNHAIGFNQVQDFEAVSVQAAATLQGYISPGGSVGDPRADVTRYLQTKKIAPETVAAEQQLIREINHEVGLYKSLAAVPADQQSNVRNDMYLASEGIRVMQKTKAPAFAAADAKALTNYKNHLDKSTKFIPGWVKLAVALALGLGTMVGWKRIVVTVGEKIGKEHLTYGQGAAAELVAMGTILAADSFGLPVSTTHVLSSGVAGTMMANKSGLQWSTIRNIAMAWIFTLPAAALLSAALFVVFRSIAK